MFTKSIEKIGMEFGRLMEQKSEMMQHNLQFKEEEMKEMLEKFGKSLDKEIQEILY